jgi:hypothetical protein
LQLDGSLPQGQLRRAGGHKKQRWDCQSCSIMKEVERVHWQRLHPGLLEMLDMAMLARA